MTITFKTAVAEKKFETVYRTVNVCVNGHHGYIGVDLVDRARGHQESITLTVQEMEQLVAFYRKNVKVTK